MAIPVARVHLKMAHAALPALLPTPPMWKTMLLPTPPPGVAAILLPKPLVNAKPSRADSDERWDAHKTMSSASSSRPCSVDSVNNNNSAGRASCRKNATMSKPGRADSAGRWDAHKKAASPSSGNASSSKWTISRASSSAERWDVHKKRCPPPQTELLDDGDSSSSTGSNDDIDMDEKILWKPKPRQAMYAAPGFVGAAPEPSFLPVPTSFLVRVA